MLVGFLGTCTTNEFYGHARLLREHMGVFDHRCPIGGRVQHGWRPGPAVHIDDFAHSQKVYAWSDRAVAESAKKGISATPIGAPWLYLLDTDLSIVPKGVLAVPQHSTEVRRFAEGDIFWQHYVGWLLNWSKSQGLDQVTVCLHAANAGVRELCESRGIAAVTCGAVFGNEEFLPKLRSYIAQAEVVTSNVACTAGMYAMAAGKPFFVGGPVPQAVANHAIRDYHSIVEDRTWVSRTFPDVTRTPTCLRDIALDELGVQYKRSRSELWEMMSVTCPTQGWLAIWEQLAGVTWT